MRDADDDVDYGEPLSDDDMDVPDEIEQWNKVELPEKNSANEKGRKNQFRFRNKVLLVTWSQVNPKKLTTQDIVDHVAKLGGVCRIGLERHKDFGWHYHAYCYNPKIFSSRSSTAFDIKGYHPNIRPVTHTHSKAWRYVAKERLVHDAIPEEPNPMANRKKSEEVFMKAMATGTKDAMLRTIQEGAPTRFCTSFASIKSAAEYIYPQDTITEYIPPDGLELFTGLYPEVQGWIDEFLPNSKYNSAAKENPISIQSTSTTEFSPQGSVSGSSRESGSVAGWTTDIESECGFSDTAGNPFERCATPCEPTLTVANRPQGRPKSLLLWGGTRLGKTLLARALGKHSYFGGMWNVREFDKDCEYAVFDDLHRGLLDLDYKEWLGGQHQFSTTDKYHKKISVSWGRPCIYISNKDPYLTAPPSVDLDWLRGNTICVEITAPTCNLAIGS